MNKLVKCNQNHEKILLEYLSLEAVRNTFLIGDILNYGFENQIQEVWANIQGGQCFAIYLWFCNNLLIYSDKEALEREHLAQVLKKRELNQVMAKKNHLEQILPMLEGFELKSKSLLACENIGKEMEKLEGREYKKATTEDVDRIYDYLQSGELAPLYGSKEMIEKRIETGDGTHLFIEESGEIVAHVNSAASTPYSTMIGGLYTKLDYREKGMAQYLLQLICDEIIEAGKIPCLISMPVPDGGVFKKLGFTQVEEFTTLELK